MAISAAPADFLPAARAPPKQRDHVHRPPTAFTTTAASARGRVYETRPGVGSSDREHADGHHEQLQFDEPRHGFRGAVPRHTGVRASSSSGPPTPAYASGPLGAATRLEA